MSSAVGHSRLERSRAMAGVLEWRWSLVVWGAMVAWSLALLAAVRTAYATFQLPRYDLGNMVQAVWSTAHGHPLEITDSGGDQIIRLASHADPVLALLAPLWMLAPSPLTLAAVQIVACALGALPVYWLGRRHLESERTAAVMALAYLLYPWLAWTALEAFHPVTLSIPLLLFAIWFLDTDRLWPFAAFAVLALATGELIGMTVAGLGVWYALACGRRLPGVVIAAVGIGWTAIALKVVVPAFNGGSSVFYERFSSVGGSPGGVVKTAFTDPGAILSAVGTVDDLAYVVWLAIPLAGAFLLAPGLAAVAAPQLFVNTLSDSAPTTDPRTHYIAAIVPVLIAASVLGLARLPKEHRLPGALLVLVLCAVLSLSVGQLLVVPGVKSFGYQSELPATHVDALRGAVALVPEGAPVSTTNRAGGHLGARRYVYSVPVLGNADWLVLDTWDPRIAKPGSTILEWDPAAFERFVQRIARSADWSKVYERDGVFVYRRATRE
jgi:uncharacterized membrane protein